MQGSSSSSSQDTSNTTQSSADVPHTWPGGTTGGMHQGGTPLQAMIQPGASPQQGASPSAAFQQQASMISQLPIMQKLMSDPGMLDRAIQASPQLRALFSQSPQLAAMMQPGPLQGLVSAAQHPADFQQYVAGTELQQLAAQLGLGAIGGLTLQAGIHLHQERLQLPMEADMGAYLTQREIQPSVKLSARHCNAAAREAGMRKGCTLWPQHAMLHAHCRGLLMCRQPQHAAPGSDGHQGYCVHLERLPFQPAGHASPTPLDVWHGALKCCVSCCSQRQSASEPA